MGNSLFFPFVLAFVVSLLSKSEAFSGLFVLSWPVIVSGLIWSLSLAAGLSCEKLSAFVLLLPSACTRELYLVPQPSRSDISLNFACATGTGTNLYQTNAPGTKIIRHGSYAVALLHVSTDSFRKGQKPTIFAISADVRNVCAHGPLPQYSILVGVLPHALNHPSASSPI